MSEGKHDDHRTLFAVPLADARQRRRVAGAGRARRDDRRHRSSDTRRYGPMLAAALCGAIGVLAAWSLGPASAPSGAGALALPHSAAKLECANCHREGEPRAAAAKACVRCHGAHPSRRAGHQRLRQKGTLRCVDCHDVHGDDQGLRIASDGSAVRYAVAAQEALGQLDFSTPHRVTVPLLPLRRCAKCHDPKRAGDPIGRCVQGAIDDSSVAVCFDEHQAWSAVAPTRPGGVCQAQHGNDRFAAWTVAREVAATTPAPRRGSGGHGQLWLAAGLIAAFAGGLGFAGVSAWRRRRRSSDEAPAMKPAEHVRLPQIDTNTCLGCYACVDACPYDVLTIERYVAEVARPEACCGLTLCEQVCPNGSLVITDGDPIGDRPRLDDRLQARDVAGLYLAGDVTGMPLIKNAIHQGRQAAEAIADGMPKHGHDLDLVIIGAGPAGISAALKAKERRLRYAVLEQGSVAQSIRSFPRGKLVFDQPLDLPVAGKLWLQESTKEELLAKWLRIVREEDLVIHEGERFTEMHAVDGGGFEVLSVSQDEEHRLRAACVLLAIGQRGTPRKLDVSLSDAAEAKVHYHLADARSFSEQRVLVVGLGDVAMETAIALSRQQGTTVTLSYRGTEFRTGKSRNIAEVERLVESGAVELVWGSEVAGISSDSVTLRTPEGRRKIANDTVFVMIGSVPPTAVLERLGVRFAVGVVPEFPEVAEAP
jgi:thioredoxin reductase/NAD-dependent dihydropyrimidine dehydrogenase PreA subunit